MTQAAAFQGNYSDWKLIRTRGVVQVVIEVPIEHSGLAYDVLGGMPQPGDEIQVAVARINSRAAAEQTLAPSTKSPASLDSAAHVPNSELDSRDGSQNSGGAPGPSTLAADFPSSAPASRRSRPVADADKAPRRRFASLPLPQQAAMLCQEGAFRVFLLEQYKDWDWPGNPARTTDDIFKGIVGITSKRDLQPNTPAGRLFEQIRDSYLNWKSVAA